MIDEDEEYQLENPVIAFFRALLGAIWALFLSILTGLVVLFLLYIVSYALIPGLPR